MTTLHENRTILSLKTKREILSLPGFDHLGHYLLSELKEFVRSRLRHCTSQPRGFTVSRYMRIYNRTPEQDRRYRPARPTARRNITPSIQRILDRETEEREERRAAARAAKSLEEAKTYDATDWSHYGGSKKERKANIIKEAKAKKAAERKQRRKENKAKRAAQHQANWEKQRAEREEAKLRDAEIKERMARKKFFENIKRNGKLIQAAREIKNIKHDQELIKGKPVKILSVENYKK